jgi:hypothetical protein
MSDDRYTEIKQWQAWLSERGLPSFPLYGITNGLCRCKDAELCRTPGKHPKIKGWRHLPDDSYEPAGPLDNLGVSTDRLVVVDCDAGVVPDDLAPTLTISTGRGFHLWYWADPHKPVGNAAGWRPKVDIRSVGGLVAAPPSRHENGSVYTYVSGEIERVPTVILDALAERKARARRPAIEVVPSDTNPLVAPLTEALVRSVREATEGTRNHNFFRVMCRFFELAESGWAGEDVLRDLYLAAVESGLHPAEVDAAIRSASQSLTR